MTDPDPRDLFDQTILPDLPDTPPELLSALRDTYVAGYTRALKEISGAVYAEFPLEQQVPEIPTAANYHLPDPRSPE